MQQFAFLLEISCIVCSDQKEKENWWTQKIHDTWPFWHTLFHRVHIIVSRLYSLDTSVTLSGVVDLKQILQIETGRYGLHNASCWLIFCWLWSVNRVLKATVNQMCYAGSDSPALQRVSKCNSLSIDTRVHQDHQGSQSGAPVPSTGNVCSAPGCRKMDHLGRWYEHIRVFPHEVSVTDTWCMGDIMYDVFHASQSIYRLCHA